MSNKGVFFAGVATGIATTMAVLIGGSVYIGRQAGKALEKVLASGEFCAVKSADTAAAVEPVVPAAE